MATTQIEPNIKTESTRQFIDVDRAVHFIVLANAGPIKAYSASTYGEIRDGILHAWADTRVECIVLKSDGDSFGAGGDLKEFLTMLEGEGPDVLVNVDTEYSRVPFRAALRCPKPVVCVVDGLCIGGGLVLSLVSDVVISTRRSTFGAPEARVGMFEPFVAEFLPPVVGLTRARYMAVTGASLDAETAERWGIVSVLVEDKAELEATLNDVIARIRRGSPTARAMYKRTMTARIPDTDVLDNYRIALGHNGQEGLRAFRDKRKPTWSPIGRDDAI